MGEQEPPFWLLRAINRLLVYLSSLFSGLQLRALLCFETVVQSGPVRWYEVSIGFVQHLTSLIDGDACQRRPQGHNTGGESFVT